MPANRFTWPPGRIPPVCLAFSSLAVPHGESRDGDSEVRLVDDSGAEEALAVPQNRIERTVDFEFSLGVITGPGQIGQPPIGRSLRSDKPKRGRIHFLTPSRKPTITVVVLGFVRRKAADLCNNHPEVLRVTVKGPGLQARDALDLSQECSDSRFPRLSGWRRRTRTAELNERRFPTFCDEREIDVPRFDSRRLSGGFVKLEAPPNTKML